MQIESIMFDWRLVVERGLPSYLHHHEDGKRVDVCEIQFLNKVIQQFNRQPSHAVAASRENNH